MVSLGSGGAITGEDFILSQLPYAKGLQFEQFFWAMRRIACLDPFAVPAPRGASAIL